MTRRSTERRMTSMSKRHSKSTALTRVSRELFKRYKWQLILIVFCILLSCAGSISSSIFIASLVDDYLEPLISSAVSGAEYSFIPMLKFVGSMSCIFAAAIISSFIYTRLMGIVTQHFLADIRNTMFGKMQTLPIRYFDTTKTGDIMSVYTNDVDALRQMIGSSFPQLISSSVTIISAVVLMLYYSIWLSLVVVVAVAAMTLISRHIAGHSVRYFIKQQQAMGSVDGYIEESLSGQKVIKVFCHEKEAKAAFDKVNNELFKATESANKYSNILMPILGNIGNLLYVVLALVGASLFLSGASNVSLRGLEPLSIGVVVAFLSMSKMFTQQVGMVSQQVNSIAMGIAGAQRIFDLIDETPEQDEGYVTLVNAKYDDNGNLTESETRTGIWAWKHYHKADDTTTYQLLQGDIYIENMDFGYNPDKLVLKDISLYAKPGQKVAFVGATGAGKTTITNLLNRFYDIDDGKIRYDGININKIKKPDLRRSLGIVLQDTNLFTGTIMENIRYGKLDATDEECIEASKIANAYDFITRLPEGFDTMLEADGANLSQGQRQLLSIARAAVADAPVMILDEATSSIDTHTEKLVQDGMDKLMEGRTVFVIAHRLSTVRNSDAIMVLDHGEIIERGSHNQLIEKKGTYYQLYTGAFELE